jgi:hypothetical protein
MYGYNQTGMGASGVGRDRITQALMNIQNPPPRTQMPQPPLAGTGMAASSPLPATSSSMPGAMPPAATGAPGVPSMPGANMPSMVPSAMPGTMSSVMPNAATPPLPQQQY